MNENMTVYQIAPMNLDMNQVRNALTDEGRVASERIEVKQVYMNHETDLVTVDFLFDGRVVVGDIFLNSGGDIDVHYCYDDPPPDRHLLDDLVPFMLAIYKAIMP